MRTRHIKIAASFCAPKRNGEVMERTITYKITDSGQNIRIDSFLRKHGYSMQNLTLLKKMPESILKNGEWSYMQTNTSGRRYSDCPHSGRNFLSEYSRCQSADRYCL